MYINNIDDKYVRILERLRDRMYGDRMILLDERRAIAKILEGVLDGIEREIDVEQVKVSDGTNT